MWRSSNFTKDSVSQISANGCQTKLCHVITLAEGQRAAPIVLPPVGLFGKPLTHEYQEVKAQEASPAPQKKPGNSSLLKINSICICTRFLMHNTKN
jgi:hypothetical protein